MACYYHANWVHVLNYYLFIYFFFSEYEYEYLCTNSRHLIAFKVKGFLVLKTNKKFKFRQKKTNLNQFPFVRYY